MNFDLSSDSYSLVLSGGGALGIAHLGVIHDLQQSSNVPDQIIGTSMGGIIGACLAIGMREPDISSQVKAFSGVENWLKFSFRGNSIIDTKKIASIFESIFGDRRMSDTDIPLKLIATHLSDGRKRVFDATDDILIRDALLATMAIPGIFREHIIDGEVYVDGFLSENLGVSEADCNHILGVDVLGSNSFESDLSNGFLKDTNVLDMFERSIRLLIYNQTRNNLKAINKKVLLLEPDTRNFKTYQFHLSHEIRATGLNLLRKRVTS
ncbi:MAG: patatin-like phospholipase family protein [Gammaproteobacteria bacterium]|nr:patatin-like phospholipase family protein [Gammaproteobacteria bacterium]